MAITFKRPVDGKKVKQTIDRRIKKLQLLSQLADDPESMELLQEMFAAEAGSNGAASHAPAVTEKQLVLHSPSNGKRKHGELLRLGEVVLRDAPSAVTSAEAVERLQKLGYVFQSASPRVSVNEAFHTLKERGIAEIADTQGVEHSWRYVKAKGTAQHKEASGQK